jgi:nitroimidazol reductase NimA-like FMN-containing flavoprotein (pyridoxamine 5'-phosphate oxidase superfamily)
VVEVEMITTNQPDTDGRMNQSLTEAECLCLLAGESIGRVVYTDGVLPTAFPVNYRLLNRSIVFRTKPDARILRSSGDLYVSFEIDRFDEAARTGWSVLVTGRCRPLHPDLVDADRDTRASAHRGSLPGISVDAVSGRRLEEP